jgi:hypothetical protein
MYWLINFKLKNLYQALFAVGVIFYIYTVTRNNLVFSANYELTQMREIDDYALQLKMFDMRADIENSELRKIIFRFDYSYGWLYWIIYSSFGYVLSKLRINVDSQETLIIFASRELTLIFFLATIILVYLSLKKLKIFDNLFQSGIIYITLLFILFSPGIMRYVVSVKPVILSVFLIYTAVYIYLPALTNQSNSKFVFGRKTLFAILLGLATGTKLTIVFSFPIIFVVLMVLGSKSVKENIRLFFADRRLITYVISYLVSLIFAISPSMFITPIRSGREVVNLISIFSRLSAGGQLNVNKSLDNFITSTQALSPGFVPLIFVTLLLTWRTNNKSQKIIVPLYLLPYGTILILSFSLENGVEWIISYSLGISIVLYVMFFYALDTIIKTDNFFKKTIFFLMIFLLPLNYMNRLPKIELNDTYSFNYFLKRYNNYKLDGTIEENFWLRTKYKEEFIVNKVVLQDFQTPLIWSNFRPGMRIFLIYDDWNNAVSVYGEFAEVIVLRKNKQYENFQKGNSINDLVRLGNFGSMTCDIDYSGKIYEVYLCK